MLVLKRKPGQWTIITNRNGDVLGVRIGRVEPDGSVNLAFDDAPRNFEIERPERKRREPAPTVVAYESIDWNAPFDPANPPPMPYATN